MILLRRLPVADLALAALLVSTWGAFYAMNETRKEATQLLEKRVYPATINGFRLNLNGCCKQVYAWSPDPQHSNQRGALILAVDDNCGVCKAKYPAWASLINQSSWSRGIEATVVSFHGDVLAKRLGDLLREKKVAHRVLLVKDHHIFGVVTGIKAVPFTALVDGSDRVRMVADELNEQSIRELSRAISGNPGLTVDYQKVLHTQGKEVKP